MKNVIKKTCAIVMMTAVLFTAVAPKPVLAACNHNNVTSNPKDKTIEQYSGSSTHYVNGQACTIYAYQVFIVNEKCMDCQAILKKTYSYTRLRHSFDHS